MLHRGKVAAHIVPPTPRQVLRWPDHLATAHKNTGRKGSAEAHRLVTAQSEVLPVWPFQDLEFLNALRFKQSLKEMSAEEVERRAVRLL